MNSRVPCVPDEELAGMAGWPADDPRRSHVAACARCSAIYASIESLADSAELEPAVDERVAARLDSAVRRGLDAASATGAGAARRVERRGWLDFLPAWGTRGNLAFAAALAAVAVTFALRLGPFERTTRERGDERPTGLRLFDARETPAGLELKWRARAGADSYRVQLLGADFEVLGAMTSGPDTTLALGRAERPEAALYWRVLADSAGIRIGESRPAGLPPR